MQAILFTLFEKSRILDLLKQVRFRRIYSAYWKEKGLPWRNYYWSAEPDLMRWPTSSWAQTLRSERNPEQGPDRLHSLLPTLHPVWLHSSKVCRSGVRWGFQPHHSRGNMPDVPFIGWKSYSRRQDMRPDRSLRSPISREGQQPKIKFRVMCSFFKDVKCPSHFFKIS